MAGSTPSTASPPATRLIKNALIAYGRLHVRAAGDWGLSANERRKGFVNLNLKQMW